MTSEETIQEYTKLFQLDVDAAEAYTQALKNIDVAAIHSQLESFKKDHERHIHTLSTEIRNLGGEVPEPTPDLKGLLIEGFTAIRSLTGTAGALKAMKGNEELTTKTYRNALERDFPEDKKRIIEAHYADERRHLAYIEEMLERKPWEEAK